MENPIAIKVENISKTFRIPHEKITSMKSAFVGAFRKRTFEEFKALDDVSFEVKKGEFFGIIGRNGSGKSTLLKILAGIYKADRGNIHINGLISPFLELGIGFNSELSGRDNIYLNATVLGLSKKQIDKKFDEIVAFSGLERFIDQKLKNYSSGMQVRLAFSVAIHAHRDILLMDEVLAVGDMNFQQKCLEELTKLKTENRTIILVSHSMKSIEDYCSRAMYLKDGKIESIGEAIKIVNDYNLNNISYFEKSSQIEEKKEREGGESNMMKKREKSGEGVQIHKETRKKIAEVKNVQFFDGNYRERKIFISGEKMIIRFFFKFNKKVELPLLGIAIYKDMQHVVYGTNSEKQWGLIKFIDTNKEGYIDFEIEELSLLEGNYQLSAAIGKKNTGMLDKHDRRYSFIVNSGTLRDYGVCNLRPKVKITLG